MRAQAFSLRAAKRRISLPLEGSEAEGAVVNDSPVDCQSRDLTEPAGETGGSSERSDGETDEVSPRRAPRLPQTGDGRTRALT